MHIVSFCCTTFQLNKQQTTAATQSDQPVFNALSKTLEFYNSRNLKTTTTSGACLSTLLGRSGLRGRCTYYSISKCCWEVSWCAATHTKDNEAAAIRDQQHVPRAAAYKPCVSATEYAYGTVSAINILHRNNNVDYWTFDRGRSKFLWRNYYLNITRKNFRVEIINLYW